MSIQGASKSAIAAPCAPATLGPILHSWRGRCIADNGSNFVFDPTQVPLLPCLQDRKPSVLSVCGHGWDV